MLITGTITVMFLALAKLAWSRIYGHNRLDNEVTLNLGSNMIKVEEDAFFDVLHHAGLSSISLHFDQAEDVTEVLILPEVFFSTHLTLEQTIEIVMNPNLVAMQMSDDKFIAAAMNSGSRPMEMKSSASLGRIKRNRLAFLHSVSHSIGRKVSHFRRALGRVTPATVPDTQRQDAFMEAVQPTAYPYISPLLAIISTKFRLGYKNVARLLGVSLRVLRFTIRWAIPATLATIRTVYRLIRHGRDALSVSDALVWLVERLPQLDPATGNRILALVNDLNEVMEDVVLQQAQMHKAMKVYLKGGSNRSIAGDVDAKAYKIPTYYHSNHPRHSGTKCTWTHHPALLGN